MGRGLTGKPKTASAGKVDKVWMARPSAAREVTAVRVMRVATSKTSKQ